MMNLKRCTTSWVQELKILCYSEGPLSHRASCLWGLSPISPDVKSCVSLCCVLHADCHVDISVCVPVLTCSHLHVSSQGADPPLTSSTGQKDGDDGQQGADSQQSTSSWTQHGTGLQNKRTRTQTHTHINYSRSREATILSQCKIWISIELVIQW